MQNLDLSYSGHSDKKVIACGIKQNTVSLPSCSFIAKPNSLYLLKLLIAVEIPLHLVTSISHKSGGSQWKRQQLYGAEG